MSLASFHALRPMLLSGQPKALARCISLVENEVEGYLTFLEQLPVSSTPVIGITGPPGAGKSTLTDGLINHWVQQNKKIGVLCVDPSSPFHLGALLGDRIRMSEWYRHPNVFIRSLATRGSLGGLHPHILEVAEVMKAAGFDYILIETVGVGQSEVEIAGLADCTVVVLVPEAGDEIQAMKAGLMEIADVFVVNKADRPDANRFVYHLKQMMQGSRDTPVIATEAHHRRGLDELAASIEHQLADLSRNDRKYWLLAEKAWHLIQAHRMKPLTKAMLKKRIESDFSSGFNLYRFVHESIGNAFEHDEDKISGRHS